MATRQQKIGYYMMFAGAGFFIGVSTYQDTCMKNILSLENSQLADNLRERLGKNIPESAKHSSNSRSPLSTQDTSEIETLSSSAKGENLFDKPAASGERARRLETMQEGGLLVRTGSSGNRDGANGMTDKSAEQVQQLTYAELRERHRSQGKSRSSEMPQAESKISPELRNTPPSVAGTGPIKRRNKYGDEIE